MACETDFDTVSGQFTPGQYTREQFTPGQFTPGRFTPSYTLPFTIALAIKTRGELSLGRTIYSGNSAVGDKVRDNLTRYLLYGVSTLSTRNPPAEKLLSIICIHFV